MVVCIDTTGLIYSIMVQMTVNVTGSFFLTTLLISIFLMAMTSFFRIPVEFSVILLLPLHLAFLACLGTNWMQITSCMLFYLAIVVGKNFFFRN